jgi:hypothetical protein
VPAAVRQSSEPISVIYYNFAGYWQVVFFSNKFLAKDVKCFLLPFALFDELGN